jgi:hypothetical protein
MKRLLLFSFIVCAHFASGQKLPGKLTFTQGEMIRIELQVKTAISQQAMGQAIDFNVEAEGDHSYKVTNSTDDNTTLNHGVDHISFSFDGMGQKKKIDSKDEKDLNGSFGKQLKEILEKKYNIIIDSNGKTLMAIPEKFDMSVGDQRMALIGNMMKDVFDLVQPPKKGMPSFFHVLPDTGTVIGQPWTESYINESGKFDAAYKVSSVTDSTVIIDFAGTSVTVSKAEMMGSETTTTMSSKSKGQIILDRLTGIIREKTVTTESTGNTETSFGTLPVTSKSTITIKVVQER